ncbi:hypothetical protein KVR01_009579 [Diaporthe batatas]|uniref:uncharacterized protein n=1 Tax=Diaporthe batatas TaxID=748121 RepID=UPI001D052AC3|nr:uncharacterized protein KVR01_009579 [Diaporthe batatas]KAG8161315.1 hypothetical protein KVR01_009579 [Diaporthe batatas]
MEAAHAQEYHVRDLPTRSITLFPTRAQVVRDIRNVVLKPGLNHITVVGLTPTVDEHSIKVEGTGAAVISDISVQLLDNADIFQEIYPDSDKDDSDQSDDDDGQDASAKDSDDESLTPARKELKAVEEKLVALHDVLKRDDEVVSNADKRLKLLEEYGKKVTPKSGADVGELVDVYDAQRRKTFQERMDATLRQRELNTEVSSLEKKRSRLLAQTAKEDKKRNKAARKEAEAKRKKNQLLIARLEKKEKEQARIHAERCKFWPRSCYTVRITLDATQYTPISSRRSSFASVTDLVKPVADEPSEAASPGTEAPSSTCDISLSYVTSAAFWSPSYDLQLNTTTNTGTLFFDAQLTNNTSETWKDCKIILSTSQAVFSGLQDDIPKLVPWRIKLARRSDDYSAGDITNSPEEVAQRAANINAACFTSHERHGVHLIGLPGQPFPNGNTQFRKQARAVGGTNHDLQDYQMQLMLLEQQGVRRTMRARQEEPPAHPAQMRKVQPQAQQQQQMQMQQAQAQSNNAFGPFGNAPAHTVTTLFGGAPSGANQQTGGGLFGAQSRAIQPASSLFGAPSGANPPPPAAANTNAGVFADKIPQDCDYDHANQLDTEDALQDFDFDKFLHFEESAVEEMGMTTTYDLPGSKTLAPSSNASKQRVARILFSNVGFSHTVVAKYRPAAFLRAKLRNASKLSLLRGPVGLTLDGTFMGRSSLPHCPSGDSFNMSLGVDPTIRVIYPNADVKRGQTGVFSKEDSTGYRRSVTITNTRGATSQTSGDGTTTTSSSSSKPVRLIVLDQVPVSEDDKLRVDIASPRGLSEGGSGVSTGSQHQVAGPKDGGKGGWGTAVATLKKSGEVRWDVELHPGKGVKLDLEYEVSFPLGDKAVHSTNSK